MLSKWILVTANHSHAGCFQFSVAMGSSVYGHSPTVTVNFCTAHNSWTSHLTSHFLVRYCRKMDTF